MRADPQHCQFCVPGWLDQYSKNGSTQLKIKDGPTDKKFTILIQNFIQEPLLKKKKIQILNCFKKNRFSHFLKIFFM